CNAKNEREEHESSGDLERNDPQSQETRRCRRVAVVEVGEQQQGHQGVAAAAAVVRAVGRRLVVRRGGGGRRRRRRRRPSAAAAAAGEQEGKVRQGPRGVQEQVPCPPPRRGGSGGGGRREQRQQVDVRGAGGVRPAGGDVRRVRGRGGGGRRRRPRRRRRLRARPRAAAQWAEDADHRAGDRRRVQLRQGAPRPQAGALLQRQRGGGQGARQDHPAAGRPPQQRLRLPRQGRHGPQGQHQGPRILSPERSYITWVLV
ncbi:hypothetical protein EE612_025708, partial [Oryza sativa]